MWGWEPATVTEYEHDEQGRVVRSTSRTEPEWDRTQHALVAALADLEADTCSGCGNPLSESMSPGADPENRDGTHFYEAGPPHRCHGCTARENRAKDYRDAPAHGALRFPVVRVDRT